MPQTKTSLVILVILIVGFLILGVYFFQQVEKQDNKNMISINNFQECVAAGNPILESYPRQCHANGQNFTEYIGNEFEKIDLIKITFPRPNQKITSPLVISGEARGYWFFEADFPVKLYDADNNLLGIAIARAQEEWMTEDFVPFIANLEFEAPKTSTGLLILEKDNPSDLPENADQLILPVSF